MQLGVWITNKLAYRSTCQCNAMVCSSSTSSSVRLWVYGLRVDCWSFFFWELWQFIRDLLVLKFYIWPNWMNPFGKFLVKISFIEQFSLLIAGTIQLRRWQVFRIFDPYPPSIGIPASCLWRGFLILMYCDLSTIGPWGHPSPLKHADDLNGWSLL